MKAAIFIAVAILAGCATMAGGPSPRAHPCDSSDCVLTVTVNSCTSITIDKPWVEYGPGKKGDLEWNLVAPPNWTFLDAVEFKNPASNSEFQNKRPGPRQVKLNNKHTQPGRHDYNVVVSPDGRTRCVLDPTIMNK